MIATDQRVNVKDKHRGHKTFAAPEILGVRCECGSVRFGTTTGVAEYDPLRDRTVRVTDGRVLYDGRND